MASTRWLVRPATRPDLPLVAELDHNVFGDDFYPLFVLRQFFDLAPEGFFVATAMDAVVGYVIAAPATDRAQGWVLSLGVAPTHRRLGIANALMREAVAALRDFGSRTARLTVALDNPSAHRLYERLGFQVEFEADDYYGPDEDRFVMALPLLGDKQRESGQKKHAPRNGSPAKTITEADDADGR